MEHNEYIEEDYKVITLEHKGNFQGYVGVKVGHPLFGKRYRDRLPGYISDEQDSEWDWDSIHVILLVLCQKKWLKKKQWI